MTNRYKYIFPTLLLMALLVHAGAHSQNRYSLNQILDSIESANPVGKMFDADIRSMDAAAKGAKSWMPPEAGAGFFMTPYNVSRWKKMDDAEPGMGSWMISLQQMFPNRKKQNADAAYMNSMSASAAEQKKSALNALFAEAKKSYYDWLMIEKKKQLVMENRQVLEFMIANAEIRYRNGLNKINAYYKAKGALGNILTMQSMLDNEAEQRKIKLNTLMNRDADRPLAIDTTLPVKDHEMYNRATAILSNRSEIRAIDQEINTAYLRVDAERAGLKPQFGIRYDHMIGFGGQPQQFSLMGMVRLPFVSWASKMVKSNTESYIWKIETLKSRKEMLLNDAAGMSAGIIRELESKKKQVALYEQNIIPALRNNYRTMLLAYEQNTEELFMLYDAWESLYMTQNEYLDQLQQWLNMQAELERILEIKN